MTPPADSSADRPDRAELAAQLDELEATLTDLRGELTDSQRGPPRPPRLGELLRFTEQYTIPTLIALLEATIKSLELLQRTLRLADPTRAAREESEAARGRLDEVGTEAGQQLAGALAELRTALSETDLPENPESRDLIADARELTGEIEGRLREAEGTVSDQWDRERAGRRAQRDDATAGNGKPTAGDSDSTASDGVMIDVSDDGGNDDTSQQSASDSDEHDNDTNDSSDGDNDEPTVDVDAELESIKNELDEAEDAIDDAENRAVDTSDDSDETEPRDDAADDNDAAEDDDTTDSDTTDDAN